MTTVPPLWRRARDVFDEVASLPEADRASRLHLLCGDDDALRAEVESLLSHDAAAGEPIAAALKHAAHELTNEVWLTSGTSILHYDIVSHVGAGAMGDVWRAVDRSLGRVVAIKVLPSTVTHDPVWLARFEREARVLATLNHANIGSIYSVHAVDGHRILAMEFADGEDLSTRLTRGAMPLDEALPVATQIAEALEAAHEQGIIHRDLKPANIRVRSDGTVKVLDFGLAKALDRLGDSPGAGMTGEAGGAVSAYPPGPPSHPGLASPPGPPGLRGPRGLALTAADAILGTAAYMAPEQAKGKPVDQRADVWAFGAVLFEMLTGQRAFQGENVADTLVSVVSKEPDWSALPGTTPAGLRRLLTRCLRKDVKSRLQAIGDARVQLDELLSGATDEASGATTHATSASTVSPHRSRLTQIAGVAAVIAVSTAVLAFAFPWLRGLREQGPVARPEMRVEITTPATADPLQFALSPDGRALVFVASGDGTSRLWLRQLDQTEAKPLAGTEGATAPFWSPDSRSIGFFAGTNLLLLDLGHGAPRALASTFGAGNGSSASWSSDGTILFSREFLGSLWRVAATGGEPRVVTQLDASRQVGHRAPHVLPDGQHFLFYVAGTPETAGIYLGSLDGSATTRLTTADSGGAFLPPDQVIFVQQGTLLARRFDIAAATLKGDPVPLADRVRVDENSATGGFAASNDGVVAYRSGAVASRQLEWVDRTGKVIGVAGDPDPNTLRYPALSPDSRHVAVGRTVQGNIDAWLIDLIRGGRTRLTFDAAVDTFPIWSPDGRQIAFASNRGGVYHIFLKPANGSSAEEKLVDSPISMVPQTWSPDGRWLVFYTLSPDTGRDLEAIDITSPDRTRRIVSKTRAEEVLAELSPNGRWVAYQTNESGRFEVVVQSFPDVGGKWQISTAGGVAPRWRADGKELYFLAPDTMMMAAPIRAAGASFEAGTPVPLFRARIVEAGSAAATRPQYAIAHDGRFLINRAVADTIAAPITLILNWKGRPPD